MPPFPEALWGRKVCGIVWCYTGRHDRAEAVLEPVKTFGSPLMVGLTNRAWTPPTLRDGLLGHAGCQAVASRLARNKVSCSTTKL